MDVYAVEGFDDITIITLLDSMVFFSNIICGKKYNSSCEIKENSNGKWVCGAEVTEPRCGMFFFCILNYTASFLKIINLMIE